MGKRRAESKSAEANKIEVLQQDLWGRLPSDVVELVVAKLAKLPFSRLLPFCYVCRSWQKFILSARAHSLFLLDAGDLLVRNLTAGGAGVWERVSLGFVGLRAKQRKSLCLIGSSGGLVGFYNNDYDYFQEFIVCNPLTRRVKRVQRPLFTLNENLDSPELSVDPVLRLVGMFTSTEESSAGHFYLVVIALHKGLVTSAVGFVYWSRNDSWTRTSIIPEALQRCFAIYTARYLIDTGPVEHLGSMYWALSMIGSENENHRIFFIKYNLESNHWSWLSSENECPVPACDVHNILPYNGKLFFLHSAMNCFEQFEIVVKESDSSPTLMLKTAPMALSGPRSFCENMLLKFVSRIGDYSVDFIEGFGVVVKSLARGIYMAGMTYYGDGGPVVYYAGALKRVVKDGVLMRKCRLDETWRMMVGMEDISGLVSSDWEKWPKKYNHYDYGGLLTPTL